MTARDGVKKSEQRFWGRCEGCGKFAFQSRRGAKRYLQNNFPGSKMTVYKCRLTDYYHFGHTPKAVIEGTQRRGEQATKKKEWMKTTQPLFKDPNEG